MRAGSEIEPLCLAFWGGKWTLGSWRRLRRDFRSFRPDRMQACEVTGEVFDDHPERNLPALLATYQQAPARMQG